MTEFYLTSLLVEAREGQELFRGFSFKPSVAFGKNSESPSYDPDEDSSSRITRNNVLVIDFGSQYLDGTTSIARTTHLGKPSREQKRVFTTILSGIIRLSMHVFPEHMLVSGIDVLTRGPMWKRKQDYRDFSGKGIGSFLSVEECKKVVKVLMEILVLLFLSAPINIAQSSEENLVFKDGNFFTVSPSYFKQGEFGIKLRNVLEVVDTGKKTFSGAKFLKFSDATLVPFDIRMIELALLTAEEVEMLNIFRRIKTN